MPPRRQPRQRTAAVRQELQVPARWEGAERIPILFANHVFVRLQDDQFLVTFGQAELPYELQISEETKARLKKDGILIRTVVRLAIPPIKMGEIIQHLSTVHNVWQERQQQGGAS